MVLELKLDTSQFQKGAKEIASSTKKIKDETSKSGKDIETSAAKASDGINKLMLSFAGLFALLTAGKGVKQFVNDITQGDAALGRFAGTVGMSSKTLQGWQGAVESVGGSAGDAASDIRMLSDQLQGLALSGDASKLATIGKIQAMSGKRINLMANPAEQLEQYNVALHALYQKNPAAEGYLSRQLGITDADNQLLIMAAERVKKLRQEFEKFAASDEDIQSAEKRQDLWAILIKQSASLGRSILTMLTPAILQAGAAVRDFLDKHGQDLKKWFADVGQAILNAPWKEWLGDIKEIAKDVDWAVKGTVGWKAALLGLLGVQVLNWLTPVVAAFGLLNGFLLSIVGVGPALAALFAVGGPLAALAGLYGLVRPQPLNEGEDEIARQRRYGQGGAGAGSGGGGAAQNGSPWNRQTGGPPAELTKPYGDKMPSHEEFQKSLTAGNGATQAPSVGGEGYGGLHPDYANEILGGGLATFEVAGHKVTTNKEAAPFFRGFIEELQAKGAPINDLGGYNVRGKVGASGTSQHSYGNAVDINQVGRNVVTPAFQEWLNTHPKELAEAESRWHMVGGEHFGGGGRGTKPDTGHWEYGGPGTQGPAAITGAGSTKPDLTNNPGDLHFPGTELDYQKLFGGTKSNQTDQGANLYQFPSRTQGFAAMAALARKKYHAGKTSLNNLIAGQGGLTPGNKSAAANIARSMGIDPNDDLDLDNPAKMRAFQRAYSTQEGSKDAVKWLDQQKGSRLHLPHNVGAATASHVANNHHHGPVNSNNSTAHEVHVGSVNVNMAPGSDASDIARNIKPALERVKYGMQSNFSLA